MYSKGDGIKNYFFALPTLADIFKYVENFTRPDNYIFNLPTDNHKFRRLADQCHTGKYNFYVLILGCLNVRHNSFDEIYFRRVISFQNEMRVL